MTRTVFRIGNVLMLGLFMYAAVVQYNDPDPALWMGVYGAGAVCCLLYLAGRLPVVLSALVGGLCVFGTLYVLAQILFGPSTFVDETGQQMMGLAEKGRELIGFAIAALWTGILTQWVHRSPQISPVSSRPST